MIVIQLVKRMTKMPSGAGFLSRVGIQPHTAHVSTWKHENMTVVENKRQEILKLAIMGFRFFHHI